MVLIHPGFYKMVLIHPCYSTVWSCRVSDFIKRWSGVRKYGIVHISWMLAADVFLCRSLRVLLLPYRVVSS